jgi:hypothetical protein
MYAASLGQPPSMSTPHPHPPSLSPPQNGKAFFRNRFVRTEGFVQEQVRAAPGA